MTTLKYFSQPFEGKIQLPASKSISNRVLIIRALCSQPFDIYNLSEANDTKLLDQLLQQIANDIDNTLLNCEDAGTAYRFLVSFTSILKGKQYTITGNERLKNRPIAPLVDALKSIGADIHYLEASGQAPIKILGKQLSGGKINIQSNLSSQFISSLCLIAPCLLNGLEINLTHNTVSSSYINMTLQLMKQFNVVYVLDQHKISISPQTYKAHNFNIENDWSSATFFYAMAMLIPAAYIEIDGLFQNSLQGDSIIQLIALDFGVQSRFIEDKLIISKYHLPNEDNNTTYNLMDCPDLAIPFIVACAVKFPRVRITGIEHLELKESQRITALTNELKKIGIKLCYSNDILHFETIENHINTSTVLFHHYDDHRILMSLCMLTLVGFEVKFDDLKCVTKSFPLFFEQIEQLGIKQLS